MKSYKNKHRIDEIRIKGNRPSHIQLFMFSFLHDYANPIAKESIVFSSLLIVTAAAIVRRWFPPLVRLCPPLSAFVRHGPTHSLYCSLGSSLCKKEGKKLRDHQDDDRTMSF